MKPSRSAQNSVLQLHSQKQCVAQLWIVKSVPCLQVKYSSLPNYEDREEEFKAEAVLLRRRFTHEGQLVGCLLLSNIGPCRS